jgi:ABC-2 type transport system ATP-binding protein
MSTVLRKLQREILVLSLRDPIEVAPVLPGFETTLRDDGDLEVVVVAGDDLNKLFGVLEEQGLAVASLRNKANRLEELFMGLVEGKQAAEGRTG